MWLLWLGHYWGLNGVMYIVHCILYIHKREFDLNYKLCYTHLECIRMATLCAWRIPSCSHQGTVGKGQRFYIFYLFLATAGPVSPYLGVYSICSYCTVQHSCQLPEWSPLFYDGHPSKCNKHGPSSIPKNHPVWPHARLGGVNTNYSTYFFVIFESSHIAANKLYFLKFQNIQNFDCALSAKIQF